VRSVGILDFGIQVGLAVPAVDVEELRKRRKRRDLWKRRPSDMPLLGFTVPGHKEKILSGEKRQTIRKLRKYSIKINDRLYLYWHLRQKDCEKLGESVCTETFYMMFPLREGHPACHFDDSPSFMSQGHTMTVEEMEDLAKRDGFASFDELVSAVKRLHGSTGGFFQVIRWGRLEKKEA